MKTISPQALDALAQQAAASPRGRAHLNVHESADDPVQRFFVAVEPRSYVRPHRHRTRAELLTVLRGSFAVLLFDSEGCVLERHITGEDSPLIALETPPDTWHTLVSLAPGSLFLEVKQGPYDPATSVEFAGWAPAEGSPEAPALLEWMRSAEAGQAIP